MGTTRSGLSFASGVILFAFAKAAIAQSNEKMTLHDVVISARDAFAVAKSEEEKMNIKAWCNDMLRAVSHPQKDALLLAALKAIEDNKPENAGPFYQKVEKIKTIDTIIGAVLCEPEPAPRR